MTANTEHFGDLYEILTDLIDGDPSQEQLARLEHLLSETPQAFDYYRDYMRICAMLEFQRSATGMPEASQAGDAAYAIVGSAHGVAGLPQAPLPASFSYGSDSDVAGSWFSGWPVAYLVATVILGVGLAIGSLMPASRPRQIATPSKLPGRSVVYAKTDFVGQITGLVDCQWAEPQTEVVAGAHVPSGRKYALRSGLLEITYNSGAKVILQGPVTYEVESRNSGYISVGKLTAKLEKKGERREEREEGTPTLQLSESPNPSLSTLHSPLFTIKTPTATVTDLGTEFGVEVSKDGNTTSHVFRGSVRLQLATADGKMGATTHLLRENESARVERNRDAKGGGAQITFARLTASPASFVRTIPRPTIKVLDLVDVVAGGDGFSGRRNRGIDPRNGRVTNTAGIANPMIGDEKYHRVSGMPFVDGVFIPHGDGGPVQLDSTGHSCVEFPATDNKTCNALWAGKADNDSAELDGIDYASSDRGHLAMDANKGVTFDLEAIRRANPGYKLARFRAVAGNTEQVSEKGAPVYADVWVFLDGQVQFRRREINRYNGAMPIMIPINDKDRFLTLVATDGGNGYQQDHIMFGDPRLELVPAKDRHDMRPQPDGSGERR